MNLLPWRTFRLELPHNSADMLQQLAESIPRCSSRKTGSYFCGTVEAASGRFTLYRNGLPRVRLLTPVLRGTLEPTGVGTLLEFSITPSIGFWCSVLVLALPVGFTGCWLLLWMLQGSVTGHPLTVCIIGVVGVLSTSWIWGSAILFHYLHIPRYREEFTRLFRPASERAEMIDQAVAIRSILIHAQVSRLSGNNTESKTTESNSFQPPHRGPRQ